MRRAANLVLAVTKSRGIRPAQFSAGVPLVWVVDPATQTVTVYCSLQEIKMLSADQELEGGEVLPGFRVRVAEIFAI
ncbi:MAG: Uma2 family endonuclease [Acidobacteria bacterium]|nr:Uma2 family endonuclease [Acidobacteriota bacterium]